MVRPSLRRRKGVRSADLGRSCSAAAPAQCSSRDQASGASGASGATTPLASVAPPLRSVRTGGDLSTSRPLTLTAALPVAESQVKGQASSLKDGPCRISMPRLAQSSTEMNEGEPSDPTSLSPRH